MRFQIVSRITKNHIMKEVSTYISYNEVIYSATAIKNDIDNEPSKEQLDLIIAWAKEVFDPLRKWVRGSIKVNSIFRSPELNARIGGSKTSQHCVGLDKSKNSYGAAGDIDDSYRHKTNREMFHYIKDNLEFDQLIWEFGTKENPAWIHVSYRPDCVNRNQILIAHKVNGKTKYSLYKGNEHLTS